jgi:chemosensory pili system protein ChpB (putative protein-glutamate methylesterase)
MDERLQLPLRVALIAKAEATPGFSALLQDHGMDVVLDRRPGAPMPRDWNGAQVALVDLSGEVSPSLIQELLEESPVPVLLNHGGLGTTERWNGRLLAKLRELTGRAAPEGHQWPDLRVVEGCASDQPAPPRLVVLCGSMGGPRAVARFLQKLPAELPVALLLAQHISASFEELLVEQLRRCGGWRIAMLDEEQHLETGTVWVLPAASRVTVEAGGVARRRNEAWDSVQKPDMNAALSGAAEVFGAECGAIMFSGLGGDGAQGCAKVIEQGGFVWTQSPESCVISNLPEAAMRSGRIEFSGTPEQLACALASRCRPRFARPS